MIDFGQLIKDVEELPTVEEGLRRILNEVEREVESIGQLVNSSGALATALVANTEHEPEEFSSEEETDHKPE